MCCGSASRCWLFFVLILWLLLSCARQVFDLIGKLWLPVMFNLLQILGCILGLFAAGQQRISLLVSLAVSSSITVVYNVLLMLWYANILGNREDKIMSFGLPYSHSFFLRHTPLCKSQYNLTSNQWVQDKACMIPYYNIEGIQAMVHTLIGLATVLLSLLLICEAKSFKGGKQRMEEGYCSSRSSKNAAENKQMPNLAAAIYGDAERLANTKSVPPPPDSINDVSSGYMNSSYEAVNHEGDEGRKQSPRKQTKKGNKKQSQGKEGSSRHDDYSSVTTKSLTNSSVESRPVKPRPRAAAQFQSKKDSKRMVNRSVSPIRRNSDEGFSEDEVSKQYSKMRQKSLPNKRPQSMAEQRLSEAALEQLKKDSFRLEKNPSKLAPSGPRTARGHSEGSKPIRQRKTPDPHAREDSGEYLEYIRADAGSGGARPSGNTTSLVSFDPKSNTLLRVTEHVTNDDDDDNRTARSDSNAYREVLDCGVKLRARRSTSQESVPSIQAPVLTGSQLRLDSGHPSSTTNSVSPDWSQIGIPHVMQRPTMSPPLPPPKQSYSNLENDFSRAAPISAFRPVPDYQNSYPNSDPESRSKTSFSTQPAYVSMSTAIPLVDSLPVPEAPTRFLQTQSVLLHPQLPHNYQHHHQQQQQLYQNQSHFPQLHGREMLEQRQLKTVPNYEIPPSTPTDFQFSASDYGFKLIPDSPGSSPRLSLHAAGSVNNRTHSTSTSSETTQFGSRPVPGSGPGPGPGPGPATSGQIIVSNAGLLV